MKKVILALYGILCSAWLIAQPQYADSLLKERLGRGVVAIKQNSSPGILLGYPLKDS